MSQVFFQLTVCLTLIKETPLVEMSIRLRVKAVAAAARALLSFIFGDGKNTVSVH